MVDIDKLIQDLNSDDLEKRYAAWKKMQAEEQLPEEAIYALQDALRDHHLTRVAHQVLEIHKPDAIIPLRDFDQVLEDKKSSSANRV